MYQAYRPAQRNKPIAQKDLPEFHYKEVSHEIPGQYLVPKYFTTVVNNPYSPQLVTKEKHNLKVSKLTAYLCKWHGNIKGCMICTGGKLEVAEGGHVSQITVYGTLVIKAGGHVADVDLRKGGTLIVGDNGDAKRVFLNEGAKKPKVSPKGKLTQAINNRVSGFPIII